MALRLLKASLAALRTALVLLVLLQLVLLAQMELRLQKVNLAAQKTELKLLTEKLAALRMARKKLKRKKRRSNSFPTILKGPLMRPFSFSIQNVSSPYESSTIRIYRSGRHVSTFRYSSG
jgi:hypothetical protein